MSMFPPAISRRDLDMLLMARRRQADMEAFQAGMTPEPGYSLMNERQRMRSRRRAYNEAAAANDQNIRRSYAAERGATARDLTQQREAGLPVSQELRDKRDRLNSEMGDALSGSVRHGLALMRAQLQNTEAQGRLTDAEASQGIPARAAAERGLAEQRMSQAEDTRAMTGPNRQLREAQARGQRIDNRRTVRFIPQEVERRELDNAAARASIPAVDRGDALAPGFTPTPRQKPVSPLDESRAFLANAQAQQIMSEMASGGRPQLRDTLKAAQSIVGDPYAPDELRQNAYGALEGLIRQQAGFRELPGDTPGKGPRYNAPSVNLSGIIPTLAQDTAEDANGNRIYLLNGRWVTADGSPVEQSMDEIVRQGFTE